MLGDIRLEQTRFWEIEPQLRTLRARLNEYQDLILRNPVAARTMGKDLIAAENAYTQAVSKYQGLIVLFGMDPAVGLSAFPPVLVPAAIVATIIAIFELIALVWRYVNQVLTPAARAAELQEQTLASLAQEAADIRLRKQEAYQRGDIVEGQQLERAEARIGQEMQTARQPMPTARPGFFDWIQTNWPFAVMAGALILLARR